MKSLTKILSLLLLIGLSSYCVANTKSTVLLTESKSGSFTIDFLNENEVTALQFDIILSTGEFTKANIASCMSSLPKTHMGTCKLKANNKLRVIVFSQNNALLNTSTFGTFKLSNAKSQLTIENVEFVSPNSGKVEAEVLVDRVKSKFLDANYNK